MHRGTEYIPLLQRDENSWYCVSIAEEHTQSGFVLVTHYEDARHYAAQHSAFKQKCGEVRPANYLKQSPSLMQNQALAQRIGKCALPELKHLLHKEKLRFSESFLVRLVLALTRYQADFPRSPHPVFPTDVWLTDEDAVLITLAACRVQQDLSAQQSHEL